MTFFGENDLRFYLQNGFFISSSPVLKGEELVKFQQLCNNLINENFKASERAFVDHLHIKHGDFLYFAFKNELLDLAEYILGPDFGLAWSAALIKNKKSNFSLDWHSDFREGEFSSELRDHPCLSVSLAASCSTRESGCLQYLPGSHLSRSIQSDFSPGPNELSQIKYAELQPGQFVLHNPHTMHGSDSNLSDYHRILINFWYVSTNVSNLNSAGIRALKEKKPGRIHLRGSDPEKICAFSVTDYL